eukprot:362738-Chlamydomonas_euryale.AAC.3
MALVTHRLWGFHGSRHTSPVGLSWLSPHIACGAFMALVTHRPDVPRRNGRAEALRKGHVSAMHGRMVLA